MLVNWGRPPIYQNIPLILFRNIDQFILGELGVHGLGYLKSVYEGTIIRCILDTDMAHHAAICQKLQSTKVLEDKLLLKGACIHSCDLSAQVLPWQTASMWEEMVSTEFVNQAKEERSAGRTPAPFMDFQMHDLKQRGKLQRDFLDFVLIPLWNPFTELIPELRQCYRNLLSNREKYDKRASSVTSCSESGIGAEKLEPSASEGQEAGGQRVAPE